MAKTVRMRATYVYEYDADPADYESVAPEDMAWEDEDNFQGRGPDEYFKDHELVAVSVKPV